MAKKEISAREWLDESYRKKSIKHEQPHDQVAINLATGKYEDYLCGTIVVPVTITIAWKKK